MNHTKFKSEVRKFHKTVSNYLLERQNNFSDKSEIWQESIAGDNYSSTTEVVQELHDAMLDAVTNFGITIKTLK